MLDSIRKKFTNSFFENIFTFFLKHDLFSRFIGKLIPNNEFYAPLSHRIVNRNGINFSLDLSDYQEWIIFYYSKIDSSEKILDFINKDAKTIIDVGGNIGQTALFIAQEFTNPDTKIFSFEPYPSTKKKFLHNLSLNPKFTNIDLVPLGLGAFEDEISMFKECATNSGGNRIIYKDTNDLIGVEKISITTLDKFVEEQDLKQLDFLKIDVEGYEFAVLKGAKETLKNFKPDILLEVDNENLEKQGSNAKELFDFLNDLDYKFMNTNTGKRVVKYSNIDSLEHFDLFCTHSYET